jgi:hypothetical protein
LTQQQAAMLPKMISQGRPQDIEEGVRALVRQGAGDQAAEAIRLKLQDIYQTAISNVKGNAEQFRGAQFANNVTRYKNQLDSLEGAIRALPGGDDKWKNLSFLLKVFDAQGNRLPVGSATEFNRMITDLMQRSDGILGAAVRMPGKAVQGIIGVTPMLDRAAVSNSANYLTDLLSDPTGALRMLDIKNKPSMFRLQSGANTLLTTGRAMQNK